MNNNVMKSINNFKKKLFQAIKGKYIYIIILTCITLFFSYLMKENKVREYNNVGEVNSYTIYDETVTQEITMDYNKVMGVMLTLGKSSNVESKYNIEILNNSDVLKVYELDSNDLSKREDIMINLDNINNFKNKKIIIKITPIGSGNQLSIYTSSSSNVKMNIDGQNSSMSLYSKVIYHRFDGIYLYLLVIIYIVSLIIILFFDIKKIHNSICVAIIVLGSIVVFINPILDTPDEHAHLARAELTSRGILFVNKDYSEYNISKSVDKIINNYMNTVETNNLYNENGNFDYTAQFNNYATSNSFIPYVPQALGVLTGKVIGGNTFNVIKFGQLFNLIAYALMIRFAIKKIPSFKIPLSIIAISPMCLFIAASMNPDAMTYGLTFLLISYFLSIYNKGNISSKEIMIFSIISIILGIVKLPYCILGGLILFIPKSKFKEKTYIKTFLFVFLIALISVSWGLFSLLNSGESGLSTYFSDNNIDTKGQIYYITNNFSDFARNFCRALYINFKDYMDQLNTFGWLTYSLDKTTMLIYSMFIGIVIFMYPNNQKLGKKMKIGIVLVSLGVYIATNIILYLSWTPIGAAGISGVQGRYFCGILALMTLISNIYIMDKDKEKYNIDKLNIKFISIAIVFVTVFLITLINRYY